MNIRGVYLCAHDYVPHHGSQNMYASPMALEGTQANQKEEKKRKIRNFTQHPHFCSEFRIVIENN